MEIKNVDEFGNVIANIDWTKWKRVRMEEVQDSTGKVIDLISHCVRISQEELDEMALIESENNLKSTDYIALKLCDALFSCSSIADIFEVITEHKETYQDVISQRKKWREDINRIRSK